MKIKLLFIAYLLTVSVQAFATDNSGRTSYFWFTLNAEAGGTSTNVEDVVMNNGYRIVDRSSPELSCSRAKEGESYVYRVTWQGNHFKNSPSADNLAFDIKVEAFDGTSFNLEEDGKHASVTALGAPASVELTNGALSVAGGSGINKGQTLRVTLGNVTLNGKDIDDEVGLNYTVDGFIHMGLAAVNGGSFHKYITGHGNGRGIHFVKRNEEAFRIGIGQTPLYVTGAGSKVANKGCGLSSITVKFRVTDPSLKTEDPNDFFADLPSGPYYPADAYPATPESKVEKDYPVFSWELIPRCIIYRNAFTYEESEINEIADNYPLIMMEKANFSGFPTMKEGMINTATRLKQRNPSIKTLFYWNSSIFYGDYGVIPGFNRDEWFNGNLVRGKVPGYNFENTEFIAWYKKTIMTMLESPAIDGVFFDKIGMPNWEIITDTPKGKVCTEVFHEAPDKLMFANGLRPSKDGCNRIHMNILHGSYLESWFKPRSNASPYERGVIDSYATTIALIQEAAAKRKMIILRSGSHQETMKITSVEGQKRSMEDHVDFKLGIFLAGAGEYSYYMYQDSVAGKDPQHIWSPSYIDQFQRPLGAPNGDAIRDGFNYSRSFKHADLWLDLVAEESQLLWKNTIGSPQIEGDALSQTDGSYILKGSGVIGANGNTDQCFSLSDAHYGNGDLIARVDTVSGANAFSMAGVMFRESLDADAKNVAVWVRPDGTVYMSDRSQINGGTVSVKAPKNASSRPVWIKLTRAGDEFTSFFSADGQAWHEIGTETITMTDKIEGGMVVASQDNATFALAQIGSFTRNEESVQHEMVPPRPAKK
ncbi:MULTISPECIES: putative glycoside hydrolase [unclassified Lentimonas]|uniref:putative glycoside hydrolase n=1 Tax=unclassified Lentimonas TaxID=2630993 RepID=UPI00132BBF86|nr:MULTISPECIES: putative glycoside hydrolase [unclassified Lentimonas]CAA6690028.1 Unannotated [Lentimonas sp. CC10]CAA6691104.1 Unannotated [Lentimonas sp. CC19]CAA7069283.1 Unannotated [Lentimonas sp. CC11]